MTANIKSIRMWKDNPDKSRISHVVKIDFNFPCTWTILSIDELSKILREWIKGEEMKYPLDKDVGFHSGDLRGRWMFFKFIKNIFDTYDPKLEEDKKNE